MNSPPHSDNESQMTEASLVQDGVVEKGAPVVSRPISTNDLEFWLQPIVSTNHKKIVGSEALVRYRDGEHCFSFPDNFWECGNPGDIAVIDEWMLLKANEFLLRNPTAEVNVNVSPHSIEFPEIRKLVLNSCLRYGGRYHIEITEQGLLSHIEETRKVIRQVRRRCPSIFYLDDFGTAHSGLSLLREIPEIDGLKIDGLFIQDIIGDCDRISQNIEAHTFLDKGLPLRHEINRAILESMVAMGKRLNKRLIAEKVETESSRVAISHIGVIWSQGFLFGMPSPAPK